MTSLALRADRPLTGRPARAESLKHAPVRALPPASITPGGQAPPGTLTTFQGERCRHGPVVAGDRHGLTPVPIASSPACRATWDGPAARCVHPALGHHTHPSKAATAMVIHCSWCDPDPLRRPAAHRPRSSPTLSARTQDAPDRCITRPPRTPAAPPTVERPPAYRLADLTHDRPRRVGENRGGNLSTGPRALQCRAHQPAFAELVTSAYGPRGVHRGGTGHASTRDADQR